MSTHPTTDFDWQLYADATFAGLAVLIPIPLLDAAVEGYFRRRMVRTLARRRGTTLPPAVADHLTREGCNWSGCLMWPITLTWVLLKKLSRKILYFLTVKEATDKLSFYWHRAFLLDYMLAQGHMATVEAAVHGRAALEETLANSTTSPLLQLAGQVIANARHVGRSLWRIGRRNQEDETVAQSRSLMDAQWAESSAYLETLAHRYDETYQQQRLAAEIRLSEPPPATQTNESAL